MLVIALGALTIYGVTAASIYTVENQWFDTFSCNTAPDAIYVFKHTVSAKSASVNNETWPPSFSIWKSNVAMGYCGRMNNELLPYQCCATSVNVTLTSQKSVSYEMLDENGIMYNLPQKANNMPYCIIKNGNNSFGYQSLYIKQDVCVETFACNTTTQTFNIFAKKGCTGSVSSFSILPTETTVTTRFGDLSISNSTVVANPSQNYIWKAQVPLSIITLGYTEALDVLAVIGLILIIIMFFYAFASSLLLYIKKRTPESLVEFIGYAMWFIYSLTNVTLILAPGDAYTGFTLIYVEKVVKCINNGTMAVATLIITLRSTWIGLKVARWGIWPQRLTYMGILAIHFGLNIGSYFYYQYGITKSGPVYEKIALFKTLQNYWMIFMVLFDFIPLGATLYLTVRIKSKGRFLTELKKKLEKDVPLAMFVFLCIFFSITEVVMLQFRSYTRVSLGLDWYDIVFGYYEKMPVAFHSFFQIICLDHLVATRANQTGTSKIRSVLGTKIANAFKKKSTRSMSQSSSEVVSAPGPITSGGAISDAVLEESNSPNS